MSFWNNLPKPFFALAPMEDVTDVVFRQVIECAAPPDGFFTEFMNVSGFCHPEGRKSVACRLETYNSKVPLVAQIWGTNPEEFAHTTKELVKMDKFAGIDINMGCPDKSVVKIGGGAGLIKTPELAVKIIEAVRKETAGRIPVSAKTRLGFSRVDEWELWLTTLLEQKLDALTIHLRTRKEMSKVPAHYELIPKIIKLRDEISPDTILIINGDIQNKAAGEKLQKEHTEIDGFMIGRGVFSNPFCFERKPKNHNKEELIKLLEYHLDLFDKHKKEKYEPLKKFFKIYINNFPGAAELRAKLMTTKSTIEARKILSSYLS